MNDFLRSSHLALFPFVTLALVSACTTDVAAPCAGDACEEVAPSGKADGVAFDFGAQIEEVAPPLFARIHYPIEFRDRDRDGEAESLLFESADRATSCTLTRDVVGTLARTGPYFIDAVRFPTFAGFETVGVVHVDFAPNPDGLRSLGCMHAGGISWRNVSDALFDPQNGAFMVLEALPKQTGEVVALDDETTFADARELCRRVVPSEEAPDAVYRLPNEADTRELFGRDVGEDECLWIHVVQDEPSEFAPVVSLVEGEVRLSFQTASERTCRAVCLPPRQ